ncbi:MAG: tetratricopeptide repeat protein [Janthinobacterium lividum]
MDCRKYVLMAMLLLSMQKLKAQVETFQTADSTSGILYATQNWKQLLVSGHQSVLNGIDFPDLRLRLGYASFILKNYSAALNEYEKVLENDSYNQTARYYIYLCYKYLNRDLLASQQLPYLDSIKAGQQNSQFGLISASLESSYQFADQPNRENASYTRFGLSNYLFRKLQLDQSVIYFKQSLFTDQGFMRYKNNDRQTEYFAKLSYAVYNRFTLFGAYHYLHTNYQNQTYNSHVFTAGLQFTGTYYALQGDVNLGNIFEEHLAQYNAKISFYPLGNLNLYFILRESLHNQNNQHQLIFNPTTGFKVIKNIWLETSATFGNLNNYIDNDGLYIYNAIDVSKLKLQETIYHQLNNRMLLEFNYTYDKKQLDLQTVNYNQHSITAGVLWKF